MQARRIGLLHQRGGLADEFWRYRCAEKLDIVVELGWRALVPAYTCSVTDWRGRRAFPRGTV